VSGRQEGDIRDHSGSKLAECDADLDSLRIVDVVYGNGGLTDRGSPDKDEADPFEVALRALPTGIEEAKDFAG
jgi:hypothetical protein